MPKPPLTSGPLDPLQDLGRPVLLITDKGAATPPYQVVGIERVPALGRHGFVPLLIPTAGALAGYASYGGEATAIAAGGKLDITPTALQLNPGALFQFRMLLRFVGTFPTGLSADDFDLGVSYPNAVSHWQLQQVGGVLNAAFQFAQPADATVGAAQGGDQALPGAYPAVTDPFTAAYASEIFIWGQTNLSFQLTNNGSVAVAGTDTLMIGLNISGIRYDLDTWPAELANEATERFTVGGKSQMAPLDTVLVPIHAFPPTNKAGLS